MDTGIILTVAVSSSVTTIASWYEILFIIGAYLFGSIPYMLLLSRAKGIDLSRETDMHIATWHKVGRLEGLSGIIFDLLKGIIPVLVASLLDFRLIIVVIAGIAAFIGQMWPVFEKFDGEKGNTTGGGVVATLSIYYNIYLVVVSGACIMLIGFLIRTVPRFTAPGQTFNDRMKFGGPVSNSLPLAMLLGFAAMPLVSWLLHAPSEITIAMVVVFVLIVIRRLTAGLCADLKTPRTGVCRILLNRFLFDRSYL
jgi:glycerol-3-phosphate acyltransferase PlsY